MRIRTKNRVESFCRAHADAASALSRWLRIAEEDSEWHSLVDVRKAFSHADEVKVSSGRTVVIFNIKGNSYRLVTAIHYNTRIIFVMFLLTHAEYDKEAWKKIL